MSRDEGRDTKPTVGTRVEGLGGGLTERENLTEQEMWWEMAKQLEQAVAARPAAKEEWLTGVYHEVEDPEFLSLLTNSLGLSKRDDVADVMRHPHYPGRNLRCDRYWCEPPLDERCRLEENGRCPTFYNRRPSAEAGRNERTMKQRRCRRH